MEVSNTRVKVIGRGRDRPEQALYMPPARRHRGPAGKNSEALKIDKEQKTRPIKILQTSVISKQKEDSKVTPLEVDLKSLDNSFKDITNKCAKQSESTSPLSESQLNKMFVNITNEEDIKPTKAKSPPVVQKSPVHETAVKIIELEEKLGDVKLKTRKSKVKDVKCDVLQISPAKNVKKSPIKLIQVDQWEDLVTSDEETTSDCTVQDDEAVIPKYDDNDAEEYENINNDLIEHIVEIYDFPSSFKTPDLMQIYNEMDPDSMYIKWLNDTRALLVLGSAMQAKRALSIENPFIKSRPVAFGSHLALEAVRTSNLRPAMKRPQTSMQAARRMITTALGAKSTVSREVQQRERDALRKAKEEKRNQRQSERDAWEGNPRPTTA